jgi:hypothetical protein
MGQSNPTIIECSRFLDHVIDNIAEQTSEKTFAQ